MNELARTGWVDHDKKTGEYVFFECSAHVERRRTFVMTEGRSQETTQAENNAMDMASAWVSSFYLRTIRELQNLGSRYVNVELGDNPADIRKLGGALYGDRRYDAVFVCQTARNFTMPPGDSVDRCGLSFAQTLTPPVLAPATAGPSPVLTMTHRRLIVQSEADLRLVRQARQVKSVAHRFAGDRRANGTSQ